MKPSWFHVQWSAYGAWLPGDPRGFRSRRHRIHSSGDYIHRPPQAEHARLHRYAQAVMQRSAVHLEQPQRQAALLAILDKAQRIRIQITAAAVAPTHAHALVQLDPERSSAIVGALKRHSSHALRREILGRVWAARAHIKQVRDARHFEAIRRYIAAHGRKERAAVWCEQEL